MKPHTWRVTITIAVIASLLLGLAALGFGIEDLRKINNVNHNIASLNGSIASSFANLKALSAAPEATMVLPANAATVSGNVVLDAAPVGDVSSIVFVASGGTSKKVQIATGKPSLAGYGAVWTSSNLANGTYQIAAVAYSSQGKKSTSPPVTVTVNNSVKNP